MLVCGDRIFTSHAYQPRVSVFLYDECLGKFERHLYEGTLG